MIRCAYCDSVTLALDLNGVDAHVCPLCGAVFARRYGNTYSFIADLKGAQGVKELLHSVRPHDPLYHAARERDGNLAPQCDQGPPACWRQHQR